MINVIGLGPGNTDYITKLGERLIRDSDILIGGKRNLESITDFKGEKIELASNLKEIVEYINNNKEKQISVIASGDPFIYGIGRYLSKNIDAKDLNVVSGISSLQYIFSKVHIDMNDLYITSSHGKTPNFDYVLSHKKVCMVTDKLIGPKQICQEILDRNLNKTVIVGENLSYHNENIIIGKPEDILKIDKFDMCVVVILEEDQI